MVTEDYVTFETAKLLKKKGFPQEYDIYHSMVYNEEDYEDEYEVQRMVLETKFIKAGTLSSYPVGVPGPKCYCPTLQMAMKWLREFHGLNIYARGVWKDVEVQYGDWEPAVVGYEWFVESLTDDTYSKMSKEQFLTYEQACEAAIKYCLENLI